MVSKAISQLKKIGLKIVEILDNVYSLKFQEIPFQTARNLQIRRLTIQLYTKTSKILSIKFRQKSSKTKSVSHITINQIQKLGGGIIHL